MRAALAACVIVIAAAGGALADEPDYARARTLYEAANAEMTSGRYDDAARDFAAAYEITRDPVLFFKIATANQKAGKCELAIGYFKKYVDQAKAEERFRELARERIKECGGDATGTGSGSGSATGSGSGSGTETGSGSVAGTGSGSGSAAKPIRRHGRNSAWIASGVTIALVGAGAVLAASSKSSQEDIRDLYNPLNGIPAQYTLAIAKKYQDLIDQGHRYQYLSWGTFGAAGAAAIVTAILFARSGASVEPSVTAHGASVSASFGF
jgi:hypothetical protein